MIVATNARVINALANRPEIFPFVSKDGHAECERFWSIRQMIDLEPDLEDDPDFMSGLNDAGKAFLDHAMNFQECVDRPEHYRIYHNGADQLDVDGATIALIFEWSSPHVWEIHTMALPTARGGEALAFAKSCVADMFLEHGARELWGQTPIANERARKFNEKLGAIPRYVGEHHIFGEVEFFATSRAEWDAFKSGEAARSTDCR